MASDKEIASLDFGVTSTAAMMSAQVRFIWYLCIGLCLGTTLWLLEAPDRLWPWIPVAFALFLAAILIVFQFDEGRESVTQALVALGVVSVLFWYPGQRLGELDYRILQWACWTVICAHLLNAFARIAFHSRRLALATKAHGEISIRESMSAAAPPWDYAAWLAGPGRDPGEPVRRLSVIEQDLGYYYADPGGDPGAVRLYCEQLGDPYGRRPSDVHLNRTKDLALVYMRQADSGSGAGAKAQSESLVYALRTMKRCPLPSPDRSTEAVGWVSGCAFADDDPHSIEQSWDERSGRRRFVRYQVDPESASIVLMDSDELSRARFASSCRALQALRAMPLKTITRDDPRYHTHFHSGKLHPDGRHALLQSTQRHVHLVDFEERRQVRQWPVGDASPSFQLLADGRRMLIWNRATTSVVSLQDPGESVHLYHRFIALHPDGKRLLVEAQGPGALVIELKSGKILSTLGAMAAQERIGYHPIMDQMTLDEIDAATPRAHFERARFSADGQRVALCTGRPEFGVFELDGGRCLLRADGTLITLFRDGRRAISRDYFKTPSFTAWNVDAGTKHFSQDNTFDADSESACIAYADGRRLLTTFERKWLLWDLDERKLLRSVDGVNSRNLLSVRVPENGLVTFEETDRAPRLWDLETLTSRAFAASGLPGGDVGRSSRGLRLCRENAVSVTSSNDLTVFWDLDTLNMLAGRWAEGFTSVLDVDERGRVLAYSPDEFMMLECA